MLKTKIIKLPSRIKKFHWFSYFKVTKPIVPNTEEIIFLRIEFVIILSEKLLKIFTYEST